MPHLASNYDYEVIVIGAGPAGYVAAIRAAQLGLKTASIDSWTDSQGMHKLGGAYVNAGCVACVALLESAKIHHLLQHDLALHGMAIKALTLDIPVMMARKNAITNQVSQQISDLFHAHKITQIYGRGKLINAKQVQVSLLPTPSSSASVTQQKTLSAKYIILATGSSSNTPNCAKIDNTSIVDSTHALSIDEVPKRLGIVGAGVIGLELASIWSKLGAKVTLLEAQNNFLSILDHEIAQEALLAYQQKGLDILLSTRVISAKTESNVVSVIIQDQTGKQTLEFDKLIVASGRKPNTENLAAPEAQLLLDESGYVHVDEYCGTNLPGVYAIGDLTLKGPMLTHKGIEEGIFVAEHIVGQHAEINYAIIPSIINTVPEIAWIGQSEQALKAIGESFKISRVSFNTNAKAQAISKTQGLVKLISHADTDKILGVHIIGEHAAELIAEAVLAMEFSASTEDLARTIHAHPTLSTTLHEASWALNNRAIHGKA